MPTHIFPSSVLEHHTAVLGKTGSGKTSTAKLLVEQVVNDGARVCILDTIKSDWWGLTSSADGKKAGLPFQILGGPKGHVPLPSTAGKAVAEIVANGALPLSIIDMADFEPGGIQRFFVDFAPTLLKKMRGVVYLVVEEAHEIAPKERAGFNAENMAIHWAKKLATAGRSRGVRLVVATQRTQSLHNALLGSCETVIVHRLTTPADQKPVLDWLKANSSKAVADEVAGSLSSLKTGTAWLCSGEAQIFENVAFPRIRTYDNTATPIGDEDHHVKTAPVDTEKLRAIIGTAVAEAEATDPKRLQARIRELERAAASGTPAPAPADDRALRAAEDRGRRLGWEDGRETHYADGYRAALKHVGAAVAAIEPPKAPTALPAPKPKTIAAPRETPAPLAMSDKPSDGLPAGEKKVLVAIAQHARGVKRDQLAILTGYKRRTRDDYLSRLRQRGLIENIEDRFQATPAGIDALGDDYDPLPTGDALRKRVLKELPEGERRVLEVVVAHYPRTVARDAIASATGYKRRTRDDYISRLKSRMLVKVAGAGAVRASDDLFDQAA